MSTITDPALEGDSGFVSGIAAGERPSAKISSRSAKQDLSRKSFVPLQDWDNPQGAHSEATLKDAGDGKLVIADIANGEFEPGWGAETKPRSQREIFLTEQAFAQGKKQGEEEEGKLAHAQGLKEGRESGYKQGFQDGEKERTFELEQRAEVLAQQLTEKRIETIASFLEQLMQREKEASRKRDTELMGLMIAIFDKILPALSQENGEKEVQLFLTAILQRFENIPQITITLAEGAQELSEMLRRRVDALLSDDKSVDALVSFQFDPSFSKDDCKIAWAEGEVERRSHALWEEVKHALQQHLPNAADEQANEQTEASSQEKAENEIVPASSSLVAEGEEQEQEDTDTEQEDAASGQHNEVAA